LTDMAGEPPVLAPEAFAERLRAAAAGGRIVAALAGAPGSGKTAAAARIAAHLRRAEPGCCVVVPMDGFHYDDRILEDRGWRARKGAPHTFDAAGLAALLDRLRANAEDEIAYPLFDRDLELSRAAAAIAPRSARVVLVEGNYLLLDAPPWSGLRSRFDLTAATRCPMAEIEARLRRRWRGYDLPEDEIARRVEENDLPNARRVLAESARPDLYLDTGPAP
jgi:Panthothenate kinase